MRSLLRKRKIPKGLYLLFVIIILMGLMLPASGSGFAQSVIAEGFMPSSQVQELLEQMTPEEKIGQLFLITFTGDSALEGSAIEQLISEYHIGGVILKAGNDNFNANTGVLETTQNLIAQLQQVEWDSSRSEIEDPITGEISNPKYIPLFVGISQEGDGPLYDQIYSEITTMPSQLTIGATWQPEYARAAGVIFGRELSSIGFNLLIGPSLEILDIPHPEVDIDMGTRTFGGDSFWVSQMGQAFVHGVNTGSENKLAVIAKFFPGYGSADRIPEEEVATVRKSLSEIKNLDLIPFYAVTGGAPSVDYSVDGLYVSHIRFQGFEDNAPRATTRPISLDPIALQALVLQDQINIWRQEGGLLISDDLGGQALRLYLDLINQSFDPRRVLLNALLAGNDMLFVSDFSSQEQEDPFTATIATFMHFAQKYREDQSFSQRVDDAVSRILAKKFDLYSNFIPSIVISSEKYIPANDESKQLVFNITRDAASLINPTKADLDEVLPDPPSRTDRLVFISDSRPVNQCSECPQQYQVGVNDLEELILRRYGPNAGRQVVGSNLESYSMEDLEILLDNRSSKEVMERRIGLSHWIIFLMTDNSSEYPSYKTLSRFLARRPDLIQGKKLIVFALNAPYYLDATDISKITAYYGLYNKTEQALDVAAYLLFDEIPATGALPVSVPGIYYSLNEALFPDPNQQILLEFDQAGEVSEIDALETPTPNPPALFEIGDAVNLRTGIIVDRNGRPVPDGTTVEFTLMIDGDSQNLRQVEFTQDGQAQTSFLITATGTHEFRAQSEQALSNALRIEVPVPLVEEATPLPTIEPTETLTPSPTFTATPVVTEAVVEVSPEQLEIVDWVIAILVSTLFAFGIFRIMVGTGFYRWGIRIGFLIFMGGILAYLYLVMEMPGISIITTNSITRGVLVVSLIGCVFGLVLGLFWRFLVFRRVNRAVVK